MCEQKCISTLGILLNLKGKQCRNNHLDANKMYITLNLIVSQKFNPSGKLLWTCFNSLRANFMCIYMKIKLVSDTDRDNEINRKIRPFGSFLIKKLSSYQVRNIFFKIFHIFRDTNNPVYETVLKVWRRKDTTLPPKHNYPQSISWGQTSFFWLRGYYLNRQQFIIPLD